MSPEIVRLEKNPGEAMDVFTSRREGEVLGTIGMPTRDFIDAATVTSLITTDVRWANELKKTIDIIILRGNVLSWQRNAIIERMRGEWLLFVDDDMVWQPDAVWRLLKHQQENDLDMVGGLCFRRAAPYQPTLYMREKPDAGAYNFLERWNEGELVEVDATGMAFMLIHKRVFEMIAGGPMPPYELRVEMGGPPPNFFRWEGGLGEDLRFCQDAKAAGARIWVATDVPIGHMGQITVTHETFLSAIASRDKATYLARKEVNDKMGLPTMSAEEARERLGWT